MGVAGTAVPVIHSREVREYMFRAMQEDKASGWLASLIDDRSSDQITETYVDLGAPPPMREWIGRRAPKTIRNESFPITAKKYETSVVIPRDDLVLVNADMIRRKYIQPLMARAGTQHIKKLATTALIDAEAAVCFDGQYFFDTDHVSAASGSQSNDITADITTTTAPTADEATAAIMSVIQTMLAFKDDQGEICNDEQNTFLIMIPLPFMQAFNVALNANLTNAGQSNQLKVQGFNLSLAVNPRLTWTTKFAVFAENNGAKPLIHQFVEAPRFSAKAEGSDFEHDEDAHEYGVSVWRTVGYGAWSSGCLCTFT